MANDPFMDLNDPEPEPAPAPPAPAVEAAAEVGPAPVVQEAAAVAPPVPAPVEAPQVPAPAPAPTVEAPAAAAASTIAARPARGKKAKPATEPAAGEIDLTSALGGLSDDEPEEPAVAKRGEVDGAFQDFHHEVTKQTGADQSLQHLTIARTYLEMGLTDEAIPALRTAAKSPTLRFEAASALGRLYKQRGESGPAIEWFERAAEAPAPNVDDGRALLYDLGTTLEDVGETARALAVFLELQTEGNEYKDVAVRAERLAGIQSGG